MSGAAQLSEMSVSAVVLSVLLAAPLVIVAVMFVWAAKRDGEEDRAAHPQPRVAGFAAALTIIAIRVFNRSAVR